MSASAPDSGGLWDRGRTTRHSACARPNGWRRGGTRSLPRISPSSARTDRALRHGDGNHPIRPAARQGAGGGHRTLCVSVVVDACDGRRMRRIAARRAFAEIVEDLVGMGDHHPSAGLLIRRRNAAVGDCATVPVKRGFVDQPIPRGSLVTGTGILPAVPFPRGLVVDTVPPRPLRKLRLQTIPSEH